MDDRLALGAAERHHLGHLAVGGIGSSADSESGDTSVAMIRRVLLSVAQVAAAVLVATSLAAGIALVRGGSFSSSFEPILWLFGALMLLMACSSLSPSVQESQNQLLSRRLGRLYKSGEVDLLGMTLTLALGAAGVFAVAVLIGSRRL